MADFRFSYWFSYLDWYCVHLTWYSAILSKWERLKPICPKWERLESICPKMSVFTLINKSFNHIVGTDRLNLYCHPDLAVNIKWFIQNCFGCLRWIKASWYYPKWNLSCYDYFYHNFETTLDQKGSSFKLTTTLKKNTQCFLYVIHLISVSVISYKCQRYGIQRYIKSSLLYLCSIK